MRVIEVIADAGHIDTITGIAEQQQVTDYWHGIAGDDGRAAMRMLVSDSQRQGVVDALQNVLGSSEGARIVILPVEAVLPREDSTPEGDRRIVSGTQTREELYNRIARDATLDSTFLLLVCLSTIVASIGLIENNVAVIVGAMVIAPLLGPNIAMAFATSLGDSKLIWQALKSNLAGVSLALLMSIMIGWIWTDQLGSAEIMLRTDVGLAGVVLALASGAAAVLSLVTGLSSALVGVMVAVALLPPTATTGMMLGSGRMQAALGAALLLAVNIVCINLSAKLMFLFKGVKPRTWLEKTRARQSLTVSVAVWLLLLVLLMVTIVLRHRFLS